MSSPNLHELEESLEDIKESLSGIEYSIRKSAENLSAVIEPDSDLADWPDILSCLLDSVKLHSTAEFEEIATFNTAWLSAYPDLAFKFHAHVMRLIFPSRNLESRENGHMAPSEKATAEATSETSESKQEQVLPETSEGKSPRWHMLHTLKEYVDAVSKGKERLLEEHEIFSRGLTFPSARKYIKYLDEIAPKSLDVLSAEKNPPIKRPTRIGHYSEYAEDILHAINLMESERMPKYTPPEVLDLWDLQNLRRNMLHEFQDKGTDDPVAQRANERFVVGRLRDLRHQEQRDAVVAFLTKIRTLESSEGKSRNFNLPPQINARTIEMVDLILMLQTVHMMDVPTVYARKWNVNMKNSAQIHLKHLALLEFADFARNCTFWCPARREIKQEQHDVNDVVDRISKEISFLFSRCATEPPPFDDLDPIDIFMLLKPQLLDIISVAPNSTAAFEEKLHFEWALRVIESFLTDSQKADLDACFERLAAGNCCGAISQFLESRKMHDWGHPFDFRLGLLQTKLSSTHKDACSTISNFAFKPTFCDKLELQILEHIGLCLQFPVDSASDKSPSCFETHLSSTFRFILNTTEHWNE